MTYPFPAVNSPALRYTRKDKFSQRSHYVWPVDLFTSPATVRCIIGKCHHHAGNRGLSAISGLCEIPGSRDVLLVTLHTVRTSVKARHFQPDLVISAYSATGENP